MFNDIVFISGVLGLNKDTNKLVDGGAAAQAKKALQNIGYILEASGSTYENVIKNTILMKDLKDYGVVNEVYRQCKYVGIFIYFFKFEKVAKYPYDGYNKKSKWLSKRYGLMSMINNRDNSVNKCSKRRFQEKLKEHNF